MCRSRRELSNAYLFAKIGVDTAENEPLEVGGKIVQYYSFVSLKVIDMHHEHESAREKRDKAKVNSKLKETIDKKLKESQQDCFVDLRRGRGVRVGVGDYPNVRRSGLGCIKADFCD